MKPFMQEFIVGFILVMVLVIFTIGGLSNMHDAQELVAGTNKCTSTTNI